MKFTVRVESSEKMVDIRKENGFYTVEIDGQKSIVDCQHFGNKDYLSLLIDNRSYLIESAPVDIDDGRYYARVMGRYFEVDVLDELLVATREAKRIVQSDGDYTVASPMPGLIVDVKVKPGDSVEAGAIVVIMEAMKMQNELISEISGVVSEVLVGAKDTVDSHTPLVRIERVE